MCRRHRIGWSLIGAVVALVWAVPSAAQLAPNARPLVLPFAVTVEAEVPGGEGAAFWLGEAAAILLADELDAHGVAALLRTDRVEAFARLQLPFVSSLTRATMLRVAELVGASDLVVGEVRLGAQVTVTARLIGVDEARQQADVTEVGSGTELFEIMERLAARLGPGPAGGLAPSLHRDHLPLGAFEQYVKGLVAATPAAQERFLEQARQQAPDDDRVLLALWDLHASQGAHEAALAAAQAVSREAPLDRQARFCAALSMIELSRFNDAYQQLQALHEEAPSAVLSNALGVIQMRRGSTPQTGVPTYFFTRAADGEPDNPDFLFNLGYAYARSRDNEAAEYWLGEVVRFAPADADAHLVRSQVLAAMGKPVEAQREFELALLLGPSQDGDVVLDAKVPTGLERLVGRLDLRPAVRVGDAIANPAQREKQELAAFHVARGRRLLEQADDRAATNELRRAIYLRPYEDEPHLLLGQIYQRGGQLREAIEEFRIAIWCRETSEARVHLGEALLESGDHDGARTEVARALVLTPDSVKAQALMQRIGGTGH